MGKRVKLSDFATWERAKKDVIYPAGSILLQVSASKGETVYLWEPQKVDAKYCVIQPDPKKIEPLYLFHGIQWFMPEWRAKYQTGLNIRPDELKHFTLMINPNRNAQRQFVKEATLVENMKREVEQDIRELEEMKRYFLGVLFP